MDRSGAGVGEGLLSDVKGARCTLSKVPTIEQRLREIRKWRGKSLRVVAELAGVTESYLRRLELGQRPLDSRSKLEALAAAFQVAPSEITGQPYPPSTENEAVAHATAQAFARSAAGYRGG